MSVRRISLCSLRSGTSLVALYSGISAALRTGQAEASHCSIGRIDERPASSAAKIARGSRPEPHTAPLPVMRIFIGLASAVASSIDAAAVDLLGMAQRDGAVRAAEAERVRQRDADAPRARRARDDIEVAVRVALDEIGVLRHR